MGNQKKIPSSDHMDLFILGAHIEQSLKELRIFHVFQRMLLVGGLEHEWIIFPFSWEFGLYFHSVGNLIIPTDFHKPSFFRGVFGKTHQPVEFFYDRRLSLLNLPSGKLTQQWKVTIFNGKTHYKWPFSKAMLNYQRVSWFRFAPVTIVMSTIVAIDKLELLAPTERYPTGASHCMFWAC